MTTDEKASPWDTETGLANDIDGWIRNPRFGTKDEYLQAVTATGSEGGQMFLVDLVDENEEIIGSQGYSIGSGWIVSDDGLSISHPKRKNVVGTSLYGLLQNRVVKELGVDMAARGLPTDAKSWDGLGFHWLQQPHATVGGQEATGLMPVELLTEKKAGAATPAEKKAAATPTEDTATKALAVLARANDQSTFQEKALAMPSVANNDTLMASVLDEGPEGFWTTHQEK